MAGTKGRTGGGKKPRPSAGKPAARARSEAKAAPRPVLGNDPFARGAAPREPAPSVVRAVSSPSPTGSPAAGHPERSEAGHPERFDSAASGRYAQDRLRVSAPAEMRTRGIPTGFPGAGHPEPFDSAAAGRYAQDRLRDAATAAERSRGTRERLGELEHRVEAALDGLEHRLADVAARTGVAGAAGELRETLARLLPRVQHALGTALDLARLLEPPERLDRYGLDARFYERALPLLDLLYATWWRTEARAMERVPARGAAIIVANHAGAVPWDALVLRHALRRDHPAQRDLRPLLDDREADLPVFGPLAIRLGGVRAAPEPAERLLRDGALLGVFPEGGSVARKRWGERYRILRFGRGGFVKIALHTGAPIIPCAIVGSEEASPGIARPGWLASTLGLAGLPGSSLHLGAAGLLPLPSRWSLRFGDPIDLSGAGPAQADDPATVNALTERVRATLQAMLDEEIAARRSVFL